jgi:hypothetical protein
MLQRRLERMGADGEWAYEHAISKLYQCLIGNREQQLAALRASL